MVVQISINIMLIRGLVSKLIGGVGIYGNISCRKMGQMIEIDLTRKTFQWIAYVYGNP